ncbi:hypothetical protein GVAV_001817 [Gurleya vavrai]
MKIYDTIIIDFISNFELEKYIDKKEYMKTEYSNNIIQDLPKYLLLVVKNIYESYKTVYKHKYFLELFCFGNEMMGNDSNCNIYNLLVEKFDCEYENIDY